MATKVKPTRLQITGTPQVGQVPTYVDKNTFAWGAGGGGGASFGRFLSLWDCTTGQPISFPEATPYTYITGDYFLIETVSTATPPVNYRPDGASYTGTASTVVEMDEVEIGDVYVYDGTIWLLQSNHGKTVTFANIAGQPTDNLNLAADLNAKQDVLTAGNNIDITSNVISADDMMSEVQTFTSKYGMTHWSTAKRGDIAKVQSTETKNITFNGSYTIPNGVDGGLRSFVVKGYSENVSPLPAGYVQYDKVSGNATINTGLSGGLATYTISGDQGPFRLRENSTMVFFGVPCKDTSNVVGIYDLVSKSFCTPSSTLTAGDVVTTPTVDVPRPVMTNNGILKYENGEWVADGNAETIKISYLP